MTVAATPQPQPWLTLEEAIEDLREAAELLQVESRTDDQHVRLSNLLDAVHDQVREVEDLLEEGDI